eukprot:1624688-Prymnesium_polylepis.1
MRVYICPYPSCARPRSVSRVRAPVACAPARAPSCVFSAPAPASPNNRRPRRSGCACAVRPGRPSGRTAATRRTRHVAAAVAVAAA